MARSELPEEPDGKMSRLSPSTGVATGLPVASSDTSTLDTGRPSRKKVKLTLEKPLTAAQAAARDIVHDKVFALPELVENIVVHLPPKNIFGCLRVSRAFYSTIKSKAIQEKVFLRLKKQDTPPKYWSFDHEVLYGGPIQAVTPSPFADVSVAELCNQGTGLAPVSLDIPSMGEWYIGPDSSILDTFVTDPPAKSAIATTVTISESWGTEESTDFYGCPDADSTQALKWRDLLSLFNTVSRGCARQDEPVEELHDLVAEMRNFFLDTETRHEMLSGGKGIEGLYIYTIPGIGIPDNEDWETNGKAP